MTYVIVILKHSYLGVDLSWRPDLQRPDKRGQTYIAQRLWTFKAQLWTPDALTLDAKPTFWTTEAQRLNGHVMPNPVLDTWRPRVW